MSIRGAGTLACRVETHLDAFRARHNSAREGEGSSSSLGPESGSGLEIRGTPETRRDESRRGRQECLRHTGHGKAWAIFGCLIAGLLAPVDTSAEPRRRALLIGNSSYEHLPRLEAPRANVDALAASLSKLQFQPELAYDLTQEALVATIRKFTDSVQPGDFVLVYYSGYGYQSDALNYIVPVGFDPKEQPAPGLTAFAIRNLERRLELRKAGTSMLVFDASRPAPGLPTGLASMPTASRMLITYSAAPNESAADSPGNVVNLFTSALIRAIDEPGSKPPTVLTRARAEVSRVSGGKQVPHVIETAVPEFMFSPGVAVTSGNSEGSAGRGAGSRGSDGGTPVIPTNPIVTTGTGPMWPMDGGDARRSGYAPYRGPRKGRVVWAAAEGGSRDANSPLVGPDGRVYVSSTRDRILKCVDNGTEVWTYPLPLNEQVSFASDGSVQVTTFTGRTRILNSEGKPVSGRDSVADARFLGMFMWQNHSYNSNGRAPDASSPTKWYFFRVDDPSWQVEVDSKAIWPVVDDGGVFYTGTMQGTLYAISNAASKIWSYPSGVSPTRGLAVTKGRELLAAVGPNLLCVRDGKLRWAFASGDGNAVAPIHDANGTIYFGKGTTFYALTPAGKEIWRLNLGDVVTTAPAMDRAGRIYVATGSRLYCIGDEGTP